MLRTTALVLGALALFSNVNVAMADDPCPVGTFVPAPTGGTLSIDEEFGAGINAKTTCIAKREDIKLVMQINKSCRDTTVINTVGENGKILGSTLENHPRSCGANRGYGIAQLKNMIRDYKVTHGVSASEIDIKVIVHGGGGLMLLNTPWNNLKGAVEDLQNSTDASVKFYFCMNTIRGLAPKLGKTTAELTAMVLPGVEYVTAGLTAIADLQEQGYIYIQP